MTGNVVEPASLRSGASRAGDSLELEHHHVGSKDDLRRESDQHVARLIQEFKIAVMDWAFDLGGTTVLRPINDGPPLFRYLAQTNGEGSPEVAELIDRLVSDTAERLDIGRERRLVRPAENNHAREVVVTVWMLRAITLHEHVREFPGAHRSAASPFHAVPTVPAAEFSAGQIIVIALLAGVLTLAGFIGFRNRDLCVGA